MKQVLLIFMMLAFAACSPYPAEVEQALRLAGRNRSELERVLERYKQQPVDSLKYRAACFLIENMPGKYSEDDKPFEAYQEMFDHLLRLPQAEYIREEVGDSLVKTYRLTSPRKRLSDLEHIKADYLIHTIERSFEVWEGMPWGKDVSFDVFCEDILPYRLGTESLEHWRDIILEQYASLYDSLRTSQMDAPAACRSVYDVIWAKKWDMRALPSSLPSTTYSMLNRTRTGPCPEMVKYDIYVMRALGIPVAWDFTPQWPFRSLGHDWFSVLDKQGTYIPEHRLIEPVEAERKMAKAYRHIYSIHWESLVYLKKQDVPPFFRNVFLRDVSSLNFSSAHISLSPDRLYAKADYVYLAVFNNQDWIPIHLAKWGNPILFTDMGKDIVYLPVIFEQSRVSPCGTPFLFTSSGKIEWLEADTTRHQTLNLLRKYPFLSTWNKQMVGGEFQAANRPDFAYKVVLHTISDVPGMYFQEVNLDKSGNFRYYRYASPKGESGNMAELEFYTDKNHRINGKIIGTSGSYQDIPFRTIEAAFDGDVLSFFDAPQVDGAWVGMDFEKKERVTKIRYLPRNDDNNVVPGQLYELFYWGHDGWVSLGQQTATGHELRYNNAPVNALFVLRNLTKGKEERIFTYENGKQVFY
jgi:hypothetical protein